MSEPESAARPKLSRRRLLKGAGAGALTAGVIYTAGTSRLLDVTRLKIPLPGLPPDLDGLTVVFAADFHLGPDFPAEKVAAAVEKISELAPDLILLGGDYITKSADYLPAALDILADLKAPRGVYAVPGNHEYWSGAADLPALLAAVGITDITNRGMPLGDPANPLWLAGLDDLWGGSPDIHAATAAAPPDAPRILLCHNPYTVHSLPPASADLILAGHTHGWQVYIPLLTRSLVPPEMSRYRCGFYKTPAGLMYVTRGVGMIAPPIRLWSRPELVLLKLQAAPPA